MSLAKCMIKYGKQQIVLTFISVNIYKTKYSAMYMVMT